MPVILLIRHAQASFGKPDYDKLSPLGHRQAAALGASLSARVGPVRTVVMGEMRRHRETAEGCLGALGTAAPPPRVEPALNEFDARDMIRRHDPLGLERLATGVKILKDRNARAHFESLFAKAMLRWTLGEHDEDYVEPWRVFSERCNGAVDAVAGELRAGETALLFTSAGPISAIAQRCLGLPNAQVQPLNQKIVNCSVTKLVVGKSGVTLSSFNDHAALEGPSKGPNGGPRGELITYR